VCGIVDVSRHQGTRAIRAIDGVLSAGVFSSVMVHDQEEVYQLDGLSAKILDTRGH
jgi:hypothetical protein